MTFLNTSAVAGSLRRVWNNAGAPTDGTSGTYAGSIAPGDILIDTTNGIIYKNINTTASPTYVPLPVPKVTVKSGDATLTVAESGIIEVTKDSVYIYLPTYVGYAGLTYTIKAMAAYTYGVHIYQKIGNGVDGGLTKTSAAQYDALTVVAGTDGYNVAATKGTWY